MTRHDREKRRAATNSTLPNIAGTLRKQSFCFLLSLSRLDSFVLLNPQHRQAANRYSQFFKTRQ